VVSFDVVTCGFSSAPLPWLDRPGDVGLPDPCAPDFLDLAFSALDGLEVDRRVLLVHPAGRTSAHRLGVLRASLRNPFVVPVGLSPQLAPAHASSRELPCSLVCCRRTTGTKPEPRHGRLEILTPGLRSAEALGPHACMELLPSITHLPIGRGG
jgi:hypothetical protein